MTSDGDGPWARRGWPVTVLAAAQQTAPLTPDATPRPRADHRSVVAPLGEETFKIQFTAKRVFRDKLREAQDLLRHRNADGNLEQLLGAALDLLIERVKKERLAVGRKPGPAPTKRIGRPATRHVPSAVRRAVYERDGGRCTFVDERGHRCGETSALELDHVGGFARTRCHGVETLRLLCRAHNQHAADQLYGRSFMDRARTSRNQRTRPGGSSRAPLL